MSQPLKSYIHMTSLLICRGGVTVSFALNIPVIYTMVPKNSVYTPLQIYFLCFYNFAHGLDENILGVPRSF